MTTLAGSILGVPEQLATSIYAAAKDAPFYILFLVFNALIILGIFLVSTPTKTKMPSQPRPHQPPVVQFRALEKAL
jgi:hypothetical protein